MNAAKVTREGRGFAAASLLLAALLVYGMVGATAVVVDSAQSLVIPRPVAREHRTFLLMLVGGGFAALLGGLSLWGLGARAWLRSDPERAFAFSLGATVVFLPIDLLIGGFGW